MLSEVTSRRGGIMMFIWLALASPIAVPGAHQDPTVNSRRTPPLTRDMRFREWVLKDLETKKRKSPEEQQLAWEQIRDDFKHIQVVSNGLMEQRASGQALDVKRVEMSAGEIYKNAGRLRTNLMLPAEEASGKDEKALRDLQLSTMLSALAGLIRRFVNNPIFNETAVLDTQAAIKAGTDLGRIMHISELIKRKCRDTK